MGNVQREEGSGDSPDAAVRRDRAVPIVLGLLLLVTTLAYVPALQAGFVNYDDYTYVLKNPHVSSGLSASGIAWAFTTSHAANWHPLTWISHMIDCDVWGVRPAGHHLTNLLLHLASTLTLFFFLRRATGAPWRTLTVAALFALHPLHVESVAWVAERKDVLSGLLGLLTMLAWVRYAERPGAGPYLLALVAFAAGLLAKPMLVTLPFVLLLLDFWPLGRARLGGVSLSARRLLLEKIPFFALSAVSAAITYSAQHAAGAVATVDEVPLAERFGNAMISCLAYLWRMVWPSGLAVFYPLPAAVPLWKTAAAAIVLLAATAAAVLGIRRRPWAAVGWLWYLGMLVPVLGFVQVGLQAMADRYTYLPLIGAFIVVVWGSADFAAGRGRVAAVMAVLVPAVTVALAATSFRQAVTWKDSETLFARVFEVAGENYVTHYHLANVLAGQGRNDEAIAHYERALALRPGAAAAHNNLATALMARGDLDEARRHCEEALRLKPDYAEAHNNLGSTLARSGGREEGIRQYEEALRLKPDYPEARNNLGVSLGVLGRHDEAAAQFEKALGERPDFVDARVNLGFLRQMQGRSAEALDEFEKALRIDPESASARYASASALQSLGRTREAAVSARRALELARAQGQDALARDIEKHLGLFGPGNGATR